MLIAIVFGEKCKKNLYFEVAAQTVGLAEKDYSPKQWFRAALPILKIVGRRSEKDLSFWIAVEVVKVAGGCYRQQLHPAASVPIVKAV